MEKDESYYQLLLQRWLQYQSSPQEAIELMKYLQKDASGRILLTKLRTEFDLSVGPEPPVDKDLSERVRKELLGNIETSALVNINTNTRFRWLRVAAAATVILSIGITSYFLLFKKETKKELTKNAKPEQVINDVEAGKNKAVLTLANGNKIVLDSAAIGKLANQGNTTVMNQGGQLIYEQENEKPGEVVFNTLTTSRGETYPLVLADGSKLWLNASSSVRFPTVFAERERQIEITGEVYCEIAKDKSRPFLVKAKDMVVEVLGTQFDINSYSDETTINTTLIEGSVKVRSKNENILLSPGQQSQLQPGGDLQLIKGVDVDEIIAWKMGYFNFESADLTTILRQFSRWYDVEIIYEGKIKPRKFFGIVSRSSTLFNVLKLLQANDIIFRLEGKKLIVTSG